MRPGYLGKWIEFICHDTNLTLEEIFDIMRARQDRIKYSEFLDELLARVPEKIAVPLKKNRIEGEYSSRDDMLP